MDETIKNDIVNEISDLKNYESFIITTDEIKTTEVNTIGNTNDSDT